MGAEHTGLVRVKPLEWKQTPPPGHDHEPFVFWAAGIGGHYIAEPDGLLWMAHDEFVWKRYETQAAAKAAAQADYEQRIPALIAASVHDELVDALRKLDCPRPCGSRPDNFLIGACFDAGECGCLAGSALAKASATGTAA